MSAVLCLCVYAWLDLMCLRRCVECFLYHRTGHQLLLQRPRNFRWPSNSASIDVNNQQDATTFFSFIIRFNSALHVSDDKFAHPQEHFLIIYTAFGTMHRHCCLLQSAAVCAVQAAVAGRQHRGCIIPQAVTHSLVLLKMGRIIARNMLS